VVVRRQYRNARRHAAARRSTAPLGEDERAEGRSEGAVLVGDLRQPEGRGDLGLRRLRVRGRAQHRSDQCLFGLVHAGVSQSHPGAAPGGGSMNPEIPTILELSMQRLAGNIGEGGAAFAQGQVGLIGMMMALSAKEYERGADIRVAENTELRTLFGELAGVVTDAGLKAHLGLEREQLCAAPPAHRGDDPCRVAQAARARAAHLDRPEIARGAAPGPAWSLSASPARPSNCGWQAPGAPGG